MATLKTKLLLRNDTTAEWSASNPVLSKGEMGVEWIISGATGVEGKCKLKLGDGYTDWNNLDYIGGDTVKIVTSGSGNTVVGLSSSEDNGITTYTLTLGNRVIGSQTTTTTLGNDDTTIPTSKAVKDAIGDLVTGVSSVKVTDDDVVIGTPSTATSGAVTIDVKHATKGPSTTANTTKGPTADVTISGSSATGSIKIPKITVDKYGHTTGLTEQTLSITMPSTTNMVTGTGLTADTIILGNGNSGVKTSSKKLESTLTDDDSKVPTSKAVTTAIAAATNAAVVMRGTLGTGGTITALPTASSSTLGDAYKVITKGTYAGQSAKVGDVFICYQPTSSTYGWMLIPSGDDIEDTWRAIQLDGAQKLSTGTSTGALNLKNVEAKSVSITYDSGFEFDVKTGYITSGKNYAVAKDGNGNLYVNVPWIDTDTHYTTGLYIGATNAKSNAATTNGNTYLKLYDNDTKRAEFNIKGTGATTVVSDANGNITINSTNTTYGIVSNTADGLAPAMSTNNNSFLMRVGSANTPTWNSLVVLDGGSASTSATEWGTITA